MDEKTRERLSFTNSMLFETPGGIRFTQDSPILPNVWLAFAAEPNKQHELILTTTQNGGTGSAAYKIREMLNHLREKRDPKNERKRPRVSYIPGQIAVKLYFDELMRVVLPLTPWWHGVYDELRALQRGNNANAAKVADWIPFPQPDEKLERESDLTDALMIMREDFNRHIHSTDGDNIKLKNEQRLSYIRAIPPDLVWLVRIAGLIGDCFHSGNPLLHSEKSLSKNMQKEFAWRKQILSNPDMITTSEDQKEELADKGQISINQARKTRKGIVDAFVGLYDNWSSDDSYPDDRLIWRITKNRPIRLAVNKSSLTVKADAAIRLFDICCENITWAVLDSGIDPNHPAFKVLTAEHEEKVRRGLKSDKQVAKEIESGKRDEKELRLSELKQSRIVKTLDFTRLREFLDFDIESQENDEVAKKNEIKLKAEIARRMADDEEKSREERADELLNELKRRIKDGKDINWQDLENAIVDHNPGVPSNDHGTHVAGILGADWVEDYEIENSLPLSQRTRKMQGVCPDINLIDVRVFREDGLTDEFELLAAIQYLRWINSRAGTMAVHGANVSLSLIHEVRRFACGQTPICEECNESAALGMVIVAAAGNRGFEQNDVDIIRNTDSYKSVSITDPGNATGVITVGATHRKRPHEYGVSYFSSRGPTGDGRLKPDIVAPGEKIKGPTPNGRAEFKDGTSMAAPHVSGVSALLMARHSELIGQPERIKKILCETATDLGREKYFQGHGLVDALRALQSV